jgi:hypothetical protein
MEQTTINQVNTLEPTVTYELESFTINATVVVFNDANEQLRIKPPVIAVPGTGSATPSVWTVVWTVVPDPGSLASVSFKDSGIVIPSASSSFPDNVSLLSEVGPGNNPSTQRQVQISNGCTFANAFGYDVSVFSGSPTRDVTSFFSTADQAPESRTIDPTIAVVKEPMG